MKIKFLSVLLVSALLPLAVIAQEETPASGIHTGKPTAGSGAVPIATPTPTYPLTPNPNDPHGVGQASGSGKGASGTGEGSATSGGVNQH